MNILLVDDDAGFNFLNSRLLRRLGVIEHLFVCDNGAKALKLIRKLKSNQNSIPKIILLDIKMPQMNGFDFLDSLQEMDLEMKEEIFVAMLSSSVDPTDKLKSYAYPQVIDYIEKPLDAGKFFTTLHKVRNKQNVQKI
ncbi:MAG: response regulator [Bacteroidetes bacterium]|nr:response regulator [Bacteroidota bacterium]